MIPRIPPELSTVLRETPELARAYLAGGCVRDWVLERETHDFDVEVFGIGYEQLSNVLGRWGRTDLVGRSFGVVKLTTVAGVTYDFSIPRRDSKVSPGHKGFAVAFDPDITPREAAARRDFTFNAMMYDPRADEVLDFYGGRADLERRILRHTSAAFPEDPLRVLRGMQMVARFDLQTAPETIALCRGIADSYRELAVDRVRGEWFKWAERSHTPSRGLQFLVDTGWMKHYPEIEALTGTPQEPDWHPEGDVFIHTGHCLDALVTLPDWQKADSETKIMLSFTVLAHDFGKPVTTHESVRHGQQRIVSPKHDREGVPLAARFLERIGTPESMIQRVLPLVANHLAHLQVTTDRSVRRLASRIEPATIPELVTVITADLFGRPPLAREISPAVHELVAKAAELDVEAGGPVAILLGRHLLELGMPEGPAVGIVLKAAYDAQLDGRFADRAGGLEWLATEEGLPLPDAVRERIESRP